MSLPDVLTTIAAVGTDKGSTLREVNPALDQVLNKRGDLSLEGRILLTAAGLKLQQQAGWLPAQDTRPLPEPCAADMLPTVNQRALHHLAVMLDGDYVGVLPEWLRNVAAQHLRVPEEALPLILEMGHKQKDLRDLIVPVLGKRGEWLAKQATSRHWSWFDLSNADKVWEKGSSEERVDLLEALRKLDPARARGMVEAIWKEEKAGERVFFLNAFKIGLSMEDEPFLEAALDDRAQDVRQTAIELLGRLPESRFTQRMITRGLPLVELGTLGATDKDESVLSISNIGHSDDQLKRDGIDLSESKQRTQVKQQLTQFVLGHVPPERWCQRFEISKQALLNIVMQAEADDYSMMINALARGAYHAHDVEFATLLTTTNIKRIDGSIHGHLLNLLPDPDAALVKLLKSNSSIEVDAIPLLRAYQRPWSSELTLILCTKVAQALQHSQPYPPLRSSMRDLAVYFPVSHADELIRRLNVPIKQEAGYYGPSWQSVIDEVRALLDFRREMLATLRS